MPHISNGPIRILAVHSDASFYGSDQMLLESVASFQDAGWDSEVILPFDGPLSLELEKIGVRVSTVETPVLLRAHMSILRAPRYALDLLRSIPRAIREIRRVQPDALYVNTITIPLWILAGWLCRVPIVCHVHEAENAIPRTVRRALNCPLSLTTSIVANSEATRQVISEAIPFLNRRIAVIYNCVRTPPAATTPRIKLRMPIRLVLVGRISVHKGTDIAVAALSILAEHNIDATLALLGGVPDGKGAFADRLREDALEAGVSSRIEWLGEAPTPWPALESADIVLVPSRMESFGNTAVEAMLAQRPVIAADTQGLREIIDVRISGELVAAEDPLALATAVERLVEDWPRAVDRALRASKDAALRFSAERYRRELVCVVELASRSSGRAVTHHL